MWDTILLLGDKLTCYKSKLVYWLIDWLFDSRQLVDLESDRRGGGRWPAPNRCYQRIQESDFKTYKYKQKIMVTINSNFIITI